MTDFLADLGDGRMPEQPCPNCGATLSGNSHAGTVAEDPSDIPAPGERVWPEVGDLTICAYCTACLRYGVRGRLETVPRDDIPDELRPIVDPIQMAFKRRHH